MRQSMARDAPPWMQGELGGVPGATNCTVYRQRERRYFFAASTMSLYG